MIEISLIYPTPEGSRSIVMDGEKISLGRGSEVDHRIDDDGLSRLHAVIYREGSRVWVVDQNSTNGTFVNDQPTAPAGTPLRSGDRLRIGNHTVLTVQIAEKSEPQPSIEATPVSPAATEDAQIVESVGSPSSILPIALIAVAIMVISISLVLIGFAVFGRDNTVVVSRNTDDDPIDLSSSPTPKPNPSASPSGSSTPLPSGTNDTFPDSNAITPTSTPVSKPYPEMTDPEKRQYIETKAMRIAQIIGNSSSEKIPSAAVDKIKAFVDAYSTRIKVKPLGGCRFGDNLQATYERAAKDAPFVIRAFNEKGVDPRVGLYLAMIESEHCTCLQSGTGPLGMFQFTYATAKLHFEPSDGVVKGASPSHPDVRCQPEPAARAAASHMKALTGRYGTGPASVPLAIGSYNSGEGGLSTNLEKALSTNSGLPRDFWTLIANGEMLSKQFQSENFKYVPKFFAAAIIGENPQDFGLKLQPISSYTK